MIEINLLPDELRTREGTPPARLAVVIGGVVFASVIGLGIAKYWLVEIPNMRTEIRNRDIEIDDLKKRKAEVEKVEAQIATLKQKVDTLDQLIQSRVRWARILDRLCDAVPADGAWFRSFSVTADNTPSPTGMPGGRRYMLNLMGYTTGGTELDRAQKLTELINNLERHFLQRDVDPKGLNTFLFARFERPRLVSRTNTTTPTPQISDPKVLKALPQDKVAIDFVMTMSFEMHTAGAMP